MKNILAPDNLPVLRRFAQSNVLIALDYDGTLAPIVPHPSHAAMRPETRDLLGEVASLYPCVVISGRSRADTLLRVGSIPVRAVVGNHGIECSQGSEGVADRVVGWLPVLKRRLASSEGVDIEDKAFSVAVHYRRSPNKRTARAAILEAAESLDDVRVVGGKQVINILPETAPDKGVALELECSRLKCARALYVGDDVTDEDVFALDQPDRILAVRVGPSRISMARYYIRNQAAIDRLLQMLVVLRTTHGDRGVARRSRCRNRNSEP
jgi:trehalose 6-phosphate phosphatase